MGARAPARRPLGAEVLKAPTRHRAQSGHLPACAALCRRAGSGRLTSARVRRRCGLRAARTPQDRRAALRPPFGPHCIRGKKLRDDVPLLPALPALPGCHRNIASPLQGDRLSRPTCPPTATEGPREQRTEQSTSASPGRTTTSVRKARPPAPEWSAPAAGIESSDSHWGRLPPFTPTFHVYWLPCLSVTLLARAIPTSFPGVHWLRLLACPAPGVSPPSQEWLADRRGVGLPAGRLAVGKDPGNSVQLRTGAGGRHGPSDCSPRPPSL